VHPDHRRHEEHEDAEDRDADDHLRFARELLELVPHGREVRIPDSAHYPNLEHPALFNDALRDFVHRLALRGVAR
jgi:pimeloyl-ACP methyl ester carboxylesterase